MSCSSSENGGGSNLEKKYKGVRRRKWGKWVSEIRVPGTQERLWLGTYATPEGAAVAHDVAFYCLRRPCKLNKLNFPEMLLSYCVLQREADLSPRSVQKVASDAGMAVDAQNIAGMTETYGVLMGKTNDEQRQSNVNVCNGSALIRNNIISNDGIWWEGVINNLDDFNGTIWGGSEEHRTGDGEALSISIEDYL